MKENVHTHNHWVCVGWEEGRGGTILENVSSGFLETFDWFKIYLIKQFNERGLQK